MELIRNGQAYCAQGETQAYTVNADKAPEFMKVGLRFDNFGLGPDRTSDFATQWDWRHVEWTIRTFARMRHPEAIRIQRALRLAAIVDRWAAAAPLQSN